MSLSRKDHRGRTSNALRAAIRACYTYHDCLYLLEFCRKLITFTGGIENLQVRVDHPADRQYNQPRVIGGRQQRRHPVAVEPKY